MNAHVTSELNKIEKVVRSRWVRYLTLEMRMAVEHADGSDDIDQMIEESANKIDNAMEMNLVQLLGQMALCDCIRTQDFITGFYIALQVQYVEDDEMMSFIEHYFEKYATIY
jgi:hypothetical protein